MIEKKLKVLILGGCASGKTTLAQFIEETLRAHGIETLVGDIDRELGCDYPEMQEKRLNGLAEQGLKVSVTTVQCHLTGW
jgi:adenylylsulfate kinase-like enzyme